MLHHALGALPSLSRWLKDHVKNSVEYIGRFEIAVALEAERRQVLSNDGDWVESCTALVEDYAGKLQIVTWTQALPMHQPQASLSQAAE